MRYQQSTFTLPTVNKSMTQTDYEIAVGLRNPDGSLRGNRFPRPTSQASMRDEWPRPACVHDPAGMLETCDMCPNRDGEARKK